MAPRSPRRSRLLALLGLVLVLLLAAVVGTVGASSASAATAGKGVKARAAGTKRKASAGSAALGRKRKARAASSSEDEDDEDDPDVIPFLASTKGRFKKGDDLTSSSELTGFLGRVARGAGKAFVGSSAFRFIAEEKMFETVAGMLAYRVAFSWSKAPGASRKARLLFTLYICLYIGALLYTRKRALALDDGRTLKVAAVPAMLGSLLDMAKKMKQQQQQQEGGAGGALGGLNAALSGGGVLQEKELTFREYDLQQVKTALDRFALFLLGMTFLHFKMKNVYMIMYWGILGPVMMLREPLFQVHLFGMEETGIRERPFGPKEEPESVEEPAEADEEGAVAEAEEGEEDGEATAEEDEDEAVTAAEEEEDEDGEEAEAEGEDEDEEMETAAEEEEEEEMEDAEAEAEEEEEEEEIDEMAAAASDDEDELSEAEPANDHAKSETPTAFHVDELEEDVHPHKHAGDKPTPELHFKVAQQDGDKQSS